VLVIELDRTDRKRIAKKGKESEKQWVRKDKIKKLKQLVCLKQ
jgi:hypothetical protein